MRVIASLSAILVSLCIAISPAYAESDYYHISVGSGYTSTTITAPGIQGISAGGVSIIADYLLTRNSGVTVDYTFTTNTQGIYSNSGGIFNIGYDYFSGFTDNISGYAGLGYTMLSISSGISGGGISYELGIDARIPTYIVENIIVNLFYRSSSLNLTQGTANVGATANTIGVGVNYLF